MTNRLVLKFTFWQDEDFWLGYLDDYPDYSSQGETQEELRENLVDIYQEIISGNIPVVRQSGELYIL